MRVGVIAPPWIPVPPPAYGGTEFAIHQLVEGLCARDVEVVLVAHPQSVTSALLRGIPLPMADVDIGQCAHELRWVMAAYELLSDDVDVIHDHTLAGAALGRHLWEGPLAFTNHGPFDSVTEPIYASAAAGGATLVAISHAQARSTEVPTCVIPHGVDVREFPFGRGPGEHLLFLGRMAPEKGAHLAIEVARRNGRRLVIAAKAREAAERRYLDDVIRPLLGDDVVFVGEAATAEKLELLASASALVNPITWPEPFGLVMTEAMACGTPVLAFAHGSAPEVIEHGVSGFLCESLDDMCAQVDAVVRLDRAACRRSVATRLGVDAMVDRHLAMYSEAVSRRSLSVRS